MKVAELMQTKLKTIGARAIRSSSALQVRFNRHRLLVQVVALRIATTGRERRST